MDPSVIRSETTTPEEQVVTQDYEEKVELSDNQF